MLTCIGLFLIGVILRFFFMLSMSGHPIEKLGTYFSDSDMAGYQEWSDQIVDGDWWGQKTWHPNYQWMQDIAPKTKWHGWWGGEQIFHQAPLYPYFLAGLKLLTSSNDNIIRWIQHLVGVFSGILLFLTVYNWTSKIKIAVFAGLLFQLYQPFYCFEYYYLREFLAIFFLNTSLYIFSCAKSSYTYLGLGIAVSLSILSRENLLPLVFIFPILILLKSESKKLKIQLIIFFAIGLLVGFGALFIRNIKVGAPVMSISNRTAEALIEGLSYDSTPTHMCLPNSLKSTLEKGEGKFTHTLKLIHKGYPSTVDIFIRFFEKIRGVISPLEPYNNLNIYFYYKEFNWLRALPGYASLILLSLFGIFLESSDLRKKNKVIFISAIFFLTLLVAPILARYRLIMVPFYCYFAALTLNKLSPGKKNLTYMLPFLLIPVIESITFYSIEPKWKTRNLEVVYMTKAIKSEDPKYNRWVEKRLSRK